MPRPLTSGAAQIDLSQRHFYTETVAASPAAAAETTIATLTLSGDLAVAQCVALYGYAAFTAGTNGVGATLKIRQTDTSGTTIKTSGAVTVVAASLYDRFISGMDEAPGSVNQVYVLTLTVASGSAASTVSAVTFEAIVF